MLWEREEVAPRALKVETCFTITQTTIKYNRSRASTNIERIRLKSEHFEQSSHVLSLQLESISFFSETC